MGGMHATGVPVYATPAVTVAAVPGMGWTAHDPVEPAAVTWGPVPTPNPQVYLAPPPPANDSPTTRAELEQLQQMARQRTPADLAQISRWSTDEHSVMTNWGKIADLMAGTYRLSPPAGARLHALLADAVYNALIACWRNKYHYLRPRPTMLDPTLTIVIPVPEHPSYPSGHACVAGAANAVLEQFFPSESAIFAATALDAVLARMKAGIHFLSDMDAGLSLGQQVAQDILAAEAQRGAPMRYLR